MHAYSGKKKWYVVMCWRGAHAHMAVWQPFRLLRWIFFLHYFFPSLLQSFLICCQCVTHSHGNSKERETKKDGIWLERERLNAPYETAFYSFVRERERRNKQNSFQLSIQWMFCMASCVLLTYFTFLLKYLFDIIYVYKIVNNNILIWNWPL